VQIAPDTELIEFENWTLRIRKSTDHASAPRILLLLHGWTGDENSMWVFTRDLPKNFWMIAPRAPHVAGSNGYSWRPVQESEKSRHSLEQLEPSAEALIHLIDQYQASAGIDAKTFDVIGFSQGAAMSGVLTFLYPQRVRRLGILAGFVPAGLDGLTAKHPLNGKPIFVAHGTKDETVPIERARASVEILEKAGAQVTYCEDEVGHKLSITCLHALRKFLSA
jgi:phospholipase/carboxylesterase